MRKIAKRHYYSSTALFHGCSRIAVQMSVRVCMVLYPAIRFPAKPTLSTSGRSLLFGLRIVKCTVHLGCGRWPKIDSEFFGRSWQATDLHVGSLRE